jgi:hypothetical protein
MTWHPVRESALRKRLRDDGVTGSVRVRTAAPDLEADGVLPLATGAQH